MQAYFDSKREKDPYSLPDVEIFYADENELESLDAEGYLPPGWYYWACFPGCLPDSDPIGPFDSEEEALQDAQDIDDIE